MTDPNRSHTELLAESRASRRSFLKIAGVGGAVLIAGCDSDEPDPLPDGTFGNLTGTVTGVDGGPLSDVEISFADGDDVSRTALTGADGSFTIETLPTGTYTILANTANFIQGIQENVTITAGGSTSVTFDLEPGGDIVFDFQNDFGVLNFAYALEQLEAAFYAAVLASPYAGITADEQAIFEDLAAHEAIHRDFFATAIEAAGGTLNDRTLIPGLTPNFEDIDFSDRATVLATAQTFEDLGVGAYNGAGRFISDTGAGPTYLTLAGKIVSVEARHASVIAGLITDNAIAADGVIDADGLDQALAPADVLAAAAPFIVNGLSATNV